jgi:hypothetical protein
VNGAPLWEDTHAFDLTSHSYTEGFLDSLVLGHYSEAGWNIPTADLGSNSWAGHHGIEADILGCFPDMLSQPIDFSERAETNFDISHVPAGWLPSPSSTRTESVFSAFSTTTASSHGSAPEEPQETAYVMEEQIEESDGSTADQSLIKQNADSPTISSARPINHRSKRRGRKGPLTAERRTGAADMRRMGACGTCRVRKSRVCLYTTKDAFHEY